MTETTAPARHRGRTDITLLITRAAGFALWGAAALAVAAVLAGYQHTVVLIVVILLLVAGALAVITGRTLLRGRQLEADISDLLQR